MTSPAPTIAPSHVPVPAHSYVNVDSDTLVLWTSSGTALSAPLADVRALLTILDGATAQKG